MKIEKIDLNIKKDDNVGFYISKFNLESEFSNELKFLIKDIEIPFYYISEIKGNLDLEGEGPSRKVIESLIKGKMSPKNELQQKVLNIHSCMQWIDFVKPEINKNNLMIIYNMMKQKITMDDQELENDFDFRRSTEDGYVNGFKTPTVRTMNKGIESLFEFIHSNLLDEYPIEKALIIQIVFIYFHPFYDLNGRIGRLLSYWYLTNKGENKLKHIIYLSLPYFRSEYVYVWNLFRKNNWCDLTTFLHWLGSTNVHTIQIFYWIKGIKEKVMHKFNDTDDLILFYLSNKINWLRVTDLMKKLEIGITKAGFYKRVETLIECGILVKSIVKNILYVQINPKYKMSNNSNFVNELFIKIKSNQTKEDITFELQD